MQVRKCVVLLAAFMVGFGVVGADAASVTSVTITAPDSGALLGIDDNFTVTAVVKDFTSDADDAVILYLVVGNDSTVVADATNTAAQFGGEPQASAIRDATGASVVKNDAGTTLTDDVDGFVAVRIVRDGTSAGDADSVDADVDGADITYTWYGSIDNTSNEVDGVRAAAIAIEGDDDTRTDATVSSATIAFDLDADRPTDPQELITAAAAVLADGNSLDLTVGGFVGTDKKVAGIGDSLLLRVKLGGALATDVFDAAGDLSVVAEILGTEFDVSTDEDDADLDTLNFIHVIAEGDFGDITGTDDATNETGSAAVYVVDAAGNRSGSTDVVATGVTVGLSFFADAELPIIDGSGDTLLPASNDTITDGTLNLGFSDDLRPLTYNLGEALSELEIIISGSADTITITNATSDIDDEGLEADAADDLTIVIGDSTFSVAADGALLDDYQNIAIDGGGITTGLKTIEVTGTDLAGNSGATLTRTNVYVDVDSLGFDRLFPTTDSELDTLDENTAIVVFQLTEHADSVLITYDKMSGDDTAAERTRALVGSELTDLTEQEITVDSLVSDTEYTLTLLGADLAGNYSETLAGTFTYDTGFVVPVISYFDIDADVAGLGNAQAAGTTITLTITARTASDAEAVTYKEAAVLKVSGGTGITLAGDGIDTEGLVPGRANLNADDWVTGARTVTLVDTVAPDTLSVSVHDCTDVDDLYLGSLDSLIVLEAAAQSQLIVSAADTIGQGDAFWVDLTLADEFGNARIGDNAFVEITTNSIGVELPAGAIAVRKGAGGFWANSHGHSGDLTLWARDIADGGFSSSAALYVDGDGSSVLDDPDEVIAQDYMGALGGGDQGGFVLLTFDASDDHGTLSGYRIWREISVDYGADADGNLVALGAPAKEMVSWGTADAVPGADVMRVVVATLDGDSTVYGVSAERGGISTKEAFDATAEVSSPYELMAETMVKSIEAAQVDPNAPVFATLSPEALAFEARGVLPRMKSTDGSLLSSIRETAAAVRSVDNIAPAAVPFIRTTDTPADIGGSITVQWTKSVDDRMLTTTVSQAVGEANTYTSLGVEGYNIHRRIGDGAWQMVGSAQAGATTFEDATVANGVRYTYKVEPFDTDNLTTTELFRSAMAIRNNVVDIDGNRIVGLFGSNNKVDFDDFFIFADHFGMNVENDMYDSAFDIVPNNAIDLDDFFAFADNFGREVAGIGKVVPTMAGLNSDARFYIESTVDMPRVGEEMALLVSLEDYVEVRGYGLTVNYDSEVLEFVEPRVVDNILGETVLAQPQAITVEDGEIHIAALGETAGDGDLGLNLIFRATQQIEDSYVEVLGGAIQDGSYGLNQITTPVSVRIETRPEVYALENNYPNPFNPETTIKYQLPDAGQVTLEVYNMLGQVVRTLVDREFQNAGRYNYQWDATNNSGQPLSSGVYFYRISAGGEFQSHKKMLLLK